MPELDVEKLLAVANSPKIGENAASLMGMVQEANKTLAEFQKTSNMLKQMGLMPLIVRGLGKKLEVDVDTPIQDKGLNPATEKHKTMIEAINKLNDAELIEFSKVLVKYETDKQGTKNKQIANK